MNNSSFFTADQSTHLKIVVVSLLASILVMVIGIAARPGPDNVQAVYKPTHAVLATTSVNGSVR
ncbi:MAG TPA: hypothetical protein VKX28_20855 [Xanthobacteraceae bacterium]|jgi:hypothetical protein|nr:hypothetical protein [Xanthobacteraceae bacterium]